MGRHRVGVQGRLVSVEPCTPLPKCQLISQQKPCLHPSTGETEGSKLENSARTAKLGRSRNGSLQSLNCHSAISTCQPRPADPPISVFLCSCVNSASPRGCENADHTAGCLTELTLWASLSSSVNGISSRWPCTGKPNRNVSSTE